MISGDNRIYKTVKGKIPAAEAAKIKSARSHFWNKNTEDDREIRNGMINVATFIFLARVAPSASSGGGGGGLSGFSLNLQ